MAEVEGSIYALGYLAENWKLAARFR